MNFGSGKYVVIILSSLQARIVMIKIPSSTDMIFWLVKIKKTLILSNVYTLGCVFINLRNVFINAITCLSIYT